ncbi:MAG: hydroxyacid dehydrogenase [Clostridia bacterium]|nr:hydroxyacid dehydrogenase [Clostridia bacterium]
MRKIIVLDAATLGEDLDLRPLEALGDVTVWQNTAPEQVAERLEGAEIALLNKVKLNESNLSGNTTLKQICIAATGFDNVDAAWCGTHGIAVCNVPGYSTDSVAQLTVTMAMTLVMHMNEYRQYVADGRYSAGKVANRLTPVYHEMRGMTWGIAGYGNIGKQVARVAEALGCRVIVHKRTPDPEAECVDLDTLCRESDILSLHVPLNGSTRGMIDREHIGMMKPGAILINAARGAVTDERAVADAVLNGHLGGFGCDVYSAEPFPESHPFTEIRALDNVCLTPHMAWGAYEARERCLRVMMDNIRALDRGEKLNRVD